MLKVTISNIDGSFVAIFDFAVHRKRDAVEALLASLVKDHGFFPENEIHSEFPDLCEKKEGQYGILAMPGEVDNPQEFFYMTHRQNTFEIYVESYGLGSVISDR